MNSFVPTPASPCVKICVVDPDSGLRVGGGGAIAEIAIAGERDAGERRAIVAGVERRRKAARSRAARGRRAGPRGRG
ncbi:MAG: DUF1289 domain-containing protein [Roseiarcus sp.]|jgi:predicted Fe-S protein YdhL (DUF1289 family)